MTPVIYVRYCDVMGHGAGQGKRGADACRKPPKPKVIAGEKELTTYYNPKLCEVEILVDEKELYSDTRSK